MHADPSQRPASASEFLSDLRRWRGRAAAREWVRQAMVAMERFFEGIANHEERTKLYSLFGASSFGLETARRRGLNLDDAWSKLHVGLARYELSQENWQAAEVALAFLPDAPESLTREIHRLRTEASERAAHVRRLERDADVTYGASTRRRLLWVVAGFWTLSPWINTLLPTRGLLALVLAGIIISAGWFQRRRLWTTQRNRTVVSLLGSAMFGNALILAAMALGVFDETGMFRATSAMNGTMLLVAGLLVDRRFFVGAVTVFAALLCAPWVVSIRPLVASTTAAVVSWAMLSVFASREPESVRTT